MREKNVLLSRFQIRCAPIILTRARRRVLFRPRDEDTRSVSSLCLCLSLRRSNQKRFSFRLGFAIRLTGLAAQRAVDSVRYKPLLPLLRNKLHAIPVRVLRFLSIAGTRTPILVAALPTPVKPLLHAANTHRVYVYAVIRRKTRKTSSAHTPAARYAPRLRIPSAQPKCSPHKKKTCALVRVASVA